MSFAPPLTLDVEPIALETTELDATDLDDATLEITELDATEFEAVDELDTTELGAELNDVLLAGL